VIASAPLCPDVGCASTRPAGSPGSPSRASWLSTRFGCLLPHYRGMPKVLLSNTTTAKSNGSPGSRAAPASRTPSCKPSSLSTFRSVACHLSWAADASESSNAYTASCAPPPPTHGPFETQPLRGRSPGTTSRCLVSAEHAVAGPTAVVGSICPRGGKSSHRRMSLRGGPLQRSR
jgi:hypothetical protein